MSHKMERTNRQKEGWKDKLKVDDIKEVAGRSKDKWKMLEEAYAHRRGPNVVVMTNIPLRVKTNNI